MAHADDLTEVELEWMVDKVLELARLPVGVFADRMTRAGEGLILSGVSPDCVRAGLKVAVDAYAMAREGLGNPLTVDEIIMLATS
jgi:hypothetical protein